MLHKSVVLKTPNSIITSYHNNGKTVSIDVEIAETIKWLWKNGVKTIGCCCGKGRKLGNRPSVILPEEYSDADIAKIKKIIKKIDKRNWIVCQWRCVEVGASTKRLFWLGKDKLI